MSGQARVNQSSIRYSDEVKDIVNLANGNTFGDRFEYICLNYIETKELKDSRLKYLDKQILDKQMQLDEISQKIYKYRDILSDLGNLFDSIEKRNTNKEAAG